MSIFSANGFLNALGNNTSFAITQAYVKLHLGDPGAAGTANPATETTRKAASFGTPSGGAVANDSAITWTGIAGTEDPTHFSLWDTVGPAGGNFLGSGTVTAAGYTAGDTYEVAIGGLTLTLAVAA